MPETPSAPLEVGQTVDLEIGDVAHGGVFVARHGGRVVFVADTAPGEAVAARVTQVKSSFARAVAVRVDEPHADRRPHVWREAGIDRDPDERPGGAEFGHLRTSAQRMLKGRVVADALRRFGGVAWSGDVEPVPGDEGGDGTGWRTRVSLHVDAEGDVGPYAARSHRVIRTAALPLAVPDLEGLATGPGARGGPGRVELVAPSVGDPRSWFVPDRRRPKGAGVVRERVGEREFVVGADGFWQVHRAAASTLSTAVGSAIDRDRLDPAAPNLDLYGGVGLLAAALADAGGATTRVETVESLEAATRHARANLADLRNATAATARVDQYLDRLVRNASAGELAAFGRATVVLDPPRSGAGARVVRALAALAPAQLVYVACDPVAFARDLGTFRELGYGAEDVRAFDLFPSTHHVECVARIRPVSR